MLSMQQLWLLQMTSQLGPYNNCSNQVLMDYHEWQVVMPINYDNPLSRICIRARDNQFIVEKKIKIQEKNKDYANLEVNIMKQINSANVAKYLYHHEDKQEKAIYLYMPFYANGDLEDYLLHHEDIDLKTRLRLFIDILVGLMELHKRFIIHRDLKLKNIFIDQNGRCVVGDLGIAIITEEYATSKIGTPAYQAPEVYTLNEYTEKVDVWAAGILAYQILNPLDNGKVPFPFESQCTLRKLFNFGGMVNNAQYMRATSKICPFDQSIPPKLVELITSMLQNDPKKRIGWIDFYQKGMLDEYDEDLRVASFKGEYKCMASTKEKIKKYADYIQEMEENYFEKLSKLLLDGQLKSSKEVNKSKMKSKRDILLAENKFELHMFFFLELRWVLDQYRYIKSNNIEHLVMEMKPFIKKVNNAHSDIKQRINTLLSSNKEKEIDYNEKYLNGQYHRKLKNHVDKVLASIQQENQI